MPCDWRISVRIQTSSISISTEIRLEEKVIKLYHQYFLLLQLKSVIKQMPDKQKFYTLELLLFPAKGMLFIDFVFFAVKYSHFGNYHLENYEFIVALFYNID